MKKTNLLIVMVLLCLSFHTKAQQICYLKGKVISADKQPLPGATVKEGQSLVLTNEEGHFNIGTTNIQGTITISYTGYQHKQVAFSKENPGPFVILLEEDHGNLKEVEINAGYYTVKDKERTGSISRITSEAIAKQPVTNLLQALQGQMSGVYVQQSSGVPGSNVNVKIRGRNSIDAGNNPFYIVDGVPFNTTSLSSVYSGSPFGSIGSSPLNVISPDDIQSIEVLKDADATAIYGSRGANGVILITTKKGTASKTQFTAAASSGLSRVAKTIEMMNTEQYIAMRNEAFANDGVQPGPTDYDMNGTWDQMRYTDWQKELIGHTTGFSKGQLSLSGGNASTQVLMSGNFQHQTSIYSGEDKYRRISAHGSANHAAMNNKLKANFSVLYSGDKNNLFNGDLTARAISLSPNAPALYLPDGKLNWANSTWINPMRELEMAYNVGTNTLVTNLTIGYQLLKNLNLKASVGYNDNRLSDISTAPSSYYDPAENKTPALAYADINNAVLKSWIAEPQIDWNKDIGEGKLSILAGMTFQAQDKDQLVIHGDGFSSDAQIDNIKAATTTRISNYQHLIYRYHAFYGRVNYNFNSKYILNLTGRRDGSSRFRPGNRFANFGAIGAAWLFAEERPVQHKFPFLSTGKLRLSYGISGNDQIGDYEYLDLYNAAIPYGGVTGLSPARLYNPDFAWELNKKLELGLELGFLDDRFMVTMNYFSNRSDNQLVQYPLALTTGFSGIRSNLNAKVENTGFELELNTLNFKRKDFRWSSAFNITFLNNRLLAFPGLAGSSYASKYVIGKPLNISKRYHYTGVNPETGLWTFKDENNDGKINAANDRETLKEIGQRFYGGFTNNIGYRRLTLSLLLQFAKQTQGNYISAISAAPGRGNHSMLILEDRWQKKGDVATIQRLTSGSNPAAKTAYDLYASSDAAITDASFIRLKNVEVAYELRNILAGPSVKIYLQGQNMFTITNYFGLDPEIGGFQLPPLKTLTAGIQLTF